MKILAEYDGKKCYIFHVYYSMKACNDVCAVVFDNGQTGVVLFDDIKIIDENYKIEKKGE